MTAELATALSMLAITLGIVGIRLLVWQELLGIVIAFGIGSIIAFVMYKFFKWIGLE